MSELSKFISERYVDLMETLNREHDQEQIEQTMKGFTIRLTDSSLGTLDNIARFFQMSRQELTQEIIESGISEIITTLATTRFHTGKKLPDDISEEDIQKGIEQERHKVIKELCK
jgi:predicted transcriptional regulator